MPTIANGNQEIFYLDEKGPADGETLLLTHGYGASSSMWQPQATALSSDYRILSWDMRGHGQSACPQDAAAYSEAHTVADMLALLDQLHIDRVHLGGLSLGGYLSLAFLLAHPERVRSLLLFSCGPGYKNDEGRAKWNRFANRLAEKLDSEGLAGLGGGPETQNAAHRSAAGLALAARGMLAQFDDRVIRSLAHIDVPTLVLVGSEDKLYHASTDYMAAKIPGAHKVVLDDARHAANLDQPEAFNQRVREFLAGV